MKIFLRQNWNCGAHGLPYLPFLPAPTASVAENFLNLGFQLRLFERLALDLVVTLRVHQIFCAKNHGELAHIHFRDQHFAVALDHLSQVARERIQIAQMNVSDAAARGALRFQGGRDRAVSRTPADDQQIAIRIARRHDIGNVLADGLDLCGSHANHFLVVQRLVIYVAGDILLFESADAMLRARAYPESPRDARASADRAYRAEIPAGRLRNVRETAESRSTLGMRHGSAPFAR